MNIKAIHMAYLADQIQSYMEHEYPGHERAIWDVTRLVLWAEQTSESHALEILATWVNYAGQPLRYTYPRRGLTRRFQNRLYDMGLLRQENLFTALQANGLSIEPAQVRGWWDWTNSRSAA